MQKFVNVYKFIIIILIIIITIFCFSYKYGISAVSKDSNEVIFVVDEKSTYLSIADKLKENNLIRSVNFYKMYIKIFKPTNLYAGTYVLNQNMGVKGIISVLTHESDYNPNMISITFKEGLNMRKIANVIAENTNNKIDDVYNLLNDKEYLNSLIDKYWFINDDILNSNLYYALEGYLFPDTYYFNNKDVTVKEIFARMLDEMENKISVYKDDIMNNSYSFHQLLTLASIVELEGSNSNDRASIAGVFYNRLNHNWTLGSDVTTYYAEKMDDWSNGLTNTQLNACNGYNTRGTCFTGLPIGPICNPGIESIKAVIMPKNNDNYYFVADCSGNVYLTKTSSEHDNIIKRLKSENNWCDN